MISYYKINILRAQQEIFSSSLIFSAQNNPIPIMKRMCSALVFASLVTWAGATGRNSDQGCRISME